MAYARVGDGEGLKTCTECLVEKPEGEFAIKRVGQDNRNAICRTCKRNYNRAHYQARKEYYFEKRDKFRRDMKVKVANHLKSHPCVDCGEKDPLVLRFSGGVGRDIRSLKVLKNEVLCLNCLRKRRS